MEIFSESLQNKNYFLIIGSTSIGNISFCNYFTKDQLEEMVGSINYEICLDELLVKENSDVSDSNYKRPADPKCDYDHTLYRLQNKYDFLNSEDPVNLYKSLYMKNKDKPRWFFLCIGVDEEEVIKLNIIRDILLFKKFSGVVQFIHDEDFEYYIEHITKELICNNIEFTTVMSEFNK